MAMNLKTFFTAEQCKLAIDLLIEQGAKVKQELYDRYNELLNKEAKEEPDTTGELLPIYPHFCKQNEYSDNLKKCIEGTVENLFAPGLDADEARKPGLLLGKIQSGKTKAFVGCMALAFDRGVDACIILTKGTNALVEQTIQRMSHDFRDCKRSLKERRYPVVSIYDIMKKRSLKRSLINKEKNVFIAKKEDDNMKYLIELFHNTELRDKKILIIDDEADFVSRSFRQKKGHIKEGVIAGFIDDLVLGLPNCRYLQVTATPYSLYLQPDEYVDVENRKVMPFRPRFTTLLDTYSQYVGSKQYFVDSADDKSMYSYLHHEVDPICIDRLSAKSRSSRSKQRKSSIMNTVVKNKNLYDLRWAIMHYFAASAIRELQEESKGGSYNTSFIMHVEKDKDGHEWEGALIEALLDEWGECIEDKRLKECDFIDLFEDIYKELSISSDLGRKQFNKRGKIAIPALPKKKAVLDRIKELIIADDYNVQLVNSDQDMRSLLSDDGQLELTHPLNLFIGGNVLDRGITVENLLGFFYGREPQIKQQASMLQHCRMYGNRSLADMAVTRLYATQTLYDDLKQVNELDDMMRAKFTEYVNDPSKDPGIEFVYHNREHGIIPCGPGSIAISNVTWWKKSSFVLPYGQQTLDSKRKMKSIVDEIDTFFNGHRERECFDMNVKDAIKMIRLAKSQFEYSRDLGNLDCKWDEEDMVNLVDRFKKKGKIKAYYRKGCDTGRVRTDRRGFIDAPVDGQIESPYVKAQASDVPVLLMQRQKGTKKKGWMGLAFYWPVLCLPKNMENIAYCPRNKKSICVLDEPVSESEFTKSAVK